MTKKDEAFKVVWPVIEIFPSMLTDEVELKDQAKKILEEAAEIYSAIEDIYDEERIGWDETDRVIEECADCVTAISNMIARIYMSWVKRRCGRFASDTINSLLMNEHVGRVYGKNWRRGHYDIKNPDVGNCIDKDGDFNGKDEQRKRKAR